MNDKRYDVRELSTSDLLPHRIAQRQYDERHAKQIAKNFVWDKFSPVDVSFREGRYWIVDGQHRTKAAIIQNNGKDLMVPCHVHYGWAEADEVRFFLSQGGKHKNVTTRDKLNVRFKSGDSEVIKMVLGAESAGFTVDFKPRNTQNRITAVSTLQKCYEGMDYEQYKGMLAVNHKAWDGEPQSMRGELLMGMAKFFKTYWNQFDSNELAKSLAKTSPTLILREGRARATKNTSALTSIDSSGTPYAREILKIYNERRRTKRLDDIL